MATAKQDIRLQEAIDGLPCQLAKFEYFSDDGEACIIGHLSQFAQASGLSRQRLRRRNGESIGTIPSVLTRLNRAFGFSLFQLTTLQRHNDSISYRDSHERCLGLSKELQGILKERA